MTMEQAHERLGHIGEEKTRSIIKYLNWKVTGKYPQWPHCGVAKAHKRNIKTDKENRKELEPEVNRILIDLTSVKNPNKKKLKESTRNQWLMIAHQQSKRKYSYFLEQKNQVPDAVCRFLEEWKQKGKPVTHIRLDSASENENTKKLAQSDKWKHFNITFEFTARDTPQQNWMVKLGFHHLISRVRVCLSRDHIPLSQRYKAVPCM